MSQNVFLLILESKNLQVKIDLKNVFCKNFIGDDILTKSSNVKININNVCNLISVSSKRFN